MPAERSANGLCLPTRRDQIEAGIASGLGKLQRHDCPPTRRVTRNHWITNGQVVPRPPEYVNGWTAGSILSNATDMAKYLQTVLRDGQPVVTPATFQQMLTPQTDLPLAIVPARFGLSWFMYPRSWAGQTVPHDGATGYNFTNAVPPRLRHRRLRVDEHPRGQRGRDRCQLALALADTAKTGITEPQAQPLPTAAFTAPPGRTNRDSSWWDISDNPTPTMQVRFPTVQGRRLMIARYAGPVGPFKVVVGQVAPETPVTKP